MRASLRQTLFVALAWANAALVKTTAKFLLCSRALAPTVPRSNVNFVAYCR